MVAWIVNVLSGVMNLVGSFSTDGMWKTAGVPLASFYWGRVAQASRRRESEERVVVEIRHERAAYTSMRVHGAISGFALER